MTERGLKNINVFIQRLQTFFLFLSRFLTFFNVFLFFSGTFFYIYDSDRVLSLVLPTLSASDEEANYSIIPQYTVRVHTHNKQVFFFFLGGESLLVSLHSIFGDLSLPFPADRRQCSTALLSRSDLGYCWATFRRLDEGVVGGGARLRRSRWPVLLGAVETNERAVLVELRRFRVLIFTQTVRLAAL